MSKNTGRASNASQAFSRLSPPKTPTPGAGATAPPPQNTRSIEREAAHPRKKTLLLSDDDALMWDQLAMTLRRDLGRKVDKSAMVRALVYLAAEDEDLRRELTEVLRREGVTA
jgi:hypothetical protein